MPFEQKPGTPSLVDHSSNACHTGRVRRTKELGPGLAKRLRLARKAAGLTVRDLADAAHTSAQTIQNLSDGLGGNSGIGLLADIARALNVSPSWLAFGSGEPNDPT